MTGFPLPVTLVLPRPEIVEMLVNAAARPIVRLIVVFGLTLLGLIAMFSGVVDMEEAFDSALMDQTRLLTQDAGPSNAKLF